MDNAHVLHDIEGLGLANSVSAAHSLAQSQGYWLAEEWHLLQVLLQEVGQPELSTEFGRSLSKNVRPRRSGLLLADAPPYAYLSLAIIYCRSDMHMTAGNLPASHTLAAGMICRDRGLAGSFFDAAGRPRLPVVRSIVYSGTPNSIHRVALMEFFEPLCRWVDKWSMNPDFIRVVNQ